VEAEMSFDAEKLAALAQKDFDQLELNVRRIAETGTLAQVTEAARLIPLIEAERAKRPAMKVAKGPRAPAKRKAAGAKRKAAR
jgi:hypothetical protein